MTPPKPGMAHSSPLPPAPSQHRLSCSCCHAFGRVFLFLVTGENLIMFSVKPEWARVSHTPALRNAYRSKLGMVRKFTPPIKRRYDLHSAMFREKTE